MNINIDRLTFIHDPHIHPALDKVPNEQNNDVYNLISYDKFQNFIIEFNQIYNLKIYTISANKFKYLSRITS